MTSLEFRAIGSARSWSASSRSRTRINDLTEAKKEVFSEAKGDGFDVKILKEIIKLRKQDQDECDEHETLLDVYMRAIGRSRTRHAVADAA